MFFQFEEHNFFQERAFSIWKHASNIIINARRYVTISLFGLVGML
jgi:hypothetical protein